VWVRSGGFFGNDDPSEAPPLSTAIVLLLLAVSVMFAASVGLILMVRLFLWPLVRG